MDEALKKIQDICDASNGRSQVFRSGCHGHLSCIRHYYVSSSQDASFSVEPGSAEDLSKIIKAIGDSNVSFAVKGGGHATNPAFSSTTGIQISMSRFTEISHDKTKSQLTVGAGCVFDEIYKVIRAEKYNIVGGGGSVGIGGYLMGGGYSLKTNQYGLGIDNLVQVEIVLPDGKKVKAAENINSDLFWAIKGGGNNFGMVTAFVLKTHPQGNNGYVYGGILTFDKPRVERVKAAIVNFTKKEDPKASIVAAFRFYRNQGDEEFKFTVLAFYDDEQPEPGTFKEFLAIPHQGELGKSSYTRLDTATTLLHDHLPADTATTILGPPERDGPKPLSFPKPVTGMGITNGRARWGNVMVSKYTQSLIDVIEEEAKVAKHLMGKYGGQMVVADIWPLSATMLKKSVDSAWPHDGTEPNGPLSVYFIWEGVENDELWVGQMKMALRHIHEIALQEKCTTDNAPVYCNTTLEDVTSPKQIYRHNLADLSALRTKYDPNNVMGKTGGFRIPFGPAVIDGTYKITNTKDNGVVGVRVWESSDPVIKSDGTTVDRFKISSGDGIAYIISLDDGSDNRIAQHTQGNDTVCTRRQGSTDTWNIIPESRRKNQLEYSIISQEGNRWVLDGTQGRWFRHLQRNPS